MKFNVLRKGSEFKIANLDSLGTDCWREQGWTLGEQPYDTRAEAEQAMEQWKQTIQKPDTK